MSPTARQRASIEVRAAALRRWALSLANAISMGLRSGEYLGRKRNHAPWAASDVMLFDTRCPGLMIEPEPSQMSDDSYAALMKALGEAPPVSPPIRVLDIELSGTYRARTAPLSGVFIIEKIWHVKPFADGLTACGWLCP